MILSPLAEQPSLEGAHFAGVIWNFQFVAAGGRILLRRRVTASLGGTCMPSMSWEGEPWYRCSSDISEALNRSGRID